MATNELLALVCAGPANVRFGDGIFIANGVIFCGLIGNFCFNDVYLCVLVFVFVSLLYFKRLL